MGNNRIKLPVLKPTDNAELECEEWELPDAPFKTIPKPKPPTGSKEERLWFIVRIAELEGALREIKFWNQFDSKPMREAISRKCKDSLQKADG